MVFQTRAGNVNRDFFTLDDASRYFHNTTASGDRCQLFALTYHGNPTWDGKYCSRELLEERPLAAV